MPKGIVEADRLEEIVEMINDLGISVRERAPSPEEIANAVNADPDTTNPVESEIGKTTDPVRMYMREMGSIQLLDRQGEIVIAKRIEQGNKKIQETVASFIPVLIIHRRTLPNNYRRPKTRTGQRRNQIFGIIFRFCP